MTIVITSAQDVIDRAPLGAIIRFSDGAPPPPARFKRKLRAWEDRNGTGRLTEKSGPREGRPGDFTLHLGNWGANGTVILSMSRHYTAASGGAFTVERVPEPGEALVLTDFMGRTELRHVAPSEAAARAWLGRHGYADARVEIVSGSPASEDGA